jgi:hypothetical protein
MNFFKMIPGAAVVALCVLPVAPASPASAQPCPDVEVVFARGTYEPPGVGGTGQSFVDALRAQTAPKTLDVYPVNYPASGDFGDRIAFARTVVDGIADAANHIQATAANCPDTRIVVGGYSQGAAVAGFVTAADVPAAVPAEYRQYIPEPMPPEVSDHVAAVVLIGKPSDKFMSDIGAPPIVIGPRYADKTLSVCAPGDTICDGAPLGGPSFAHATYGINGMMNDAATYVVSRLGSPGPLR